MQMTPKEIRNLRDRLGLTQQQFADRFGFNVFTLREWEQGRRHPENASCRLLAVIANSPDVVEQVVRATR